MFEWDEKKDAENRRKHGFGFDAITRCFDGDMMTRVDNRKDYGETRYIAIGAIDDAISVIVYTKRGDSRRIISARKAGRYEREAYKAYLEQRRRS